MREVKLPHLPSDVEARNKDLMTDLWYKGKETQIKQDKKVIKIRMKNIVIFGAPGSGKGTQSDLMIEHYGLATDWNISLQVTCSAMRLRTVRNWARQPKVSLTMAS